MFSAPDLEQEWIVSTVVELLGRQGASTEIKSFFLEDPTWSISFVIRATIRDDIGEGFM